MRKGDFVSKVVLDMLSFKERRNLVERVISSPKGVFYRELYGVGDKDASLSITSEEEWRTLPSFSKDELIPIHMLDLSFLSPRDIDHVRASSGTSGRAPLFTARTHVRGLNYRLKYHDFKNPFLAFSVPLMPHWHELFLREHNLNDNVISYDPRFPEPSIELATIAGADGASLFLYHVRTAGELMKKTGLNEKIRFLEITGEVCSMSMYEYIKETFPNATVVQSYGASEVEDVHIGIPCKPMDGTEPLAVYHQKASHYLELTDPETGEWVEPVPGAEGDLLITSYPGEPCAFPLIRYRIGDTVRLLENDCEHNTLTFTVLGRTEMDFLKVEGGILKSEEVARALRLFSSRVTDDFELHKFENKIEIYIDPKSKSFDYQRFARELERAVRVGPFNTYRDGVDKGLYPPFVCKKIAPQDGLKKRKRIVIHNQ